MKLKELLTGISVLECTADPELEIKEIFYDSRKVTPGSLFVAVSGFAADGNKFIPMAAKKGAAAVVTAKKPETDIPYVLVESDRLALALLVNNRFRGVNYMRTVFFLPAVLNNVAVGLVFRSMMHPSGLINRTLTTIGLGALTQNWLTNPKIAIFSCAFVEIWKWTGYTMVILLAGLQAIDTTYYEAAELDGASRWQQFRSVTLPLIMPAFNNAVVISIVGGLKVFDIVQALTNGGPGNATSVFGTLIYSSFSSGSYGRGCAASMILTFFVLLIALPTNRFLSGKEVEV